MPTGVSHGSRRRFLRLALTGAVVVPISGVFSRLAAADLPHVDESDPTAVSLGYKQDSAQVDSKKYPQHQASQQCSGCRYFQGKNDEWGPCLIFPGKAVHATGWCSAFSAK